MRCEDNQLRSTGAIKGAVLRQIKRKLTRHSESYNKHEVISIEERTEKTVSNQSKAETYQKPHATRKLLRRCCSHQNRYGRN